MVLPHPEVNHYGQNQRSFHAMAGIEARADVQQPFSPLRSLRRSASWREAIPPTQSRQVRQGPQRDIRKSTCPYLANGIQPGRPHGLIVSISQKREMS